MNPVDKKCRIGFIGDIMDLNGKALKVSESLKGFFSDCDVLIGNFEATLTHARKPWITDLRHDGKVLEGLAALFPPERTFLSVANNHAGDFSPEIFMDSCRRVEGAGFNIFGTVDRPFAEVVDQVRVYTASRWSNKPTRLIPDMGFVDTFDTGRSGFHVFYPHWGWEFEMFPRLEIIGEARRFLARFDAVIGHHSHTPQPVCAHETSGVVKPVAYSLGNFCFGRPFRNYYFGLALKMDIGLLLGQSGSKVARWAAGECTWSFLQCRFLNSRELLIDLTEELPLHLSSRTSCAAQRSRR